MIDVTQSETFPPEIEDIFLQYVNRFSLNIVSEITSQNVENITDVRCAIEKYLAPFHAEALYKEILLCFNRHSICCFHATKILSEQSIWDKGLLTNEWEQYSNLLKDVLCQTELSEPIIDEALCYVEQEYQRKYCFSPKPQLYFFTPISAVDGGDSAGYDQFCQNVGGELARWSLMNKMPNVYKTLKAIGIPVIVEFELSFSDIANFQKESISYCFVTYYSAKKFWKMDCPVIFDGSTEKGILSSQIIKILRYKEVDYEEDFF